MLDKAPWEARIQLPSEVTSKDDFKELLKGALEIRIVRKEDAAKVKVRTQKGLYTYKTTGAEADALVKGVKAAIVEF